LFHHVFQQLYFIIDWYNFPFNFCYGIRYLHLQ
jgi:hypothetical protein